MKTKEKKEKKKDKNGRMESDGNGNGHSNGDSVPIHHGDLIAERREIKNKIYLKELAGCRSNW